MKTVKYSALVVLALLACGNASVRVDPGSWNRKKKSGYNITMVKVTNGKVTGHEVFASGWLNDADQKVWGGPVDVLLLPDGSMLISDDQANVVYRVSYKG